MARTKFVDVTSYAQAELGRKYVPEWVAIVAVLAMFVCGCAALIALDQPEKPQACQCDDCCCETCRCGEKP